MLNRIRIALAALRGRPICSGMTIVGEVDFTGTRGGTISGNTILHRPGVGISTHPGVGISFRADPA